MTLGRCRRLHAAALGSAGAVLAVAAAWRFVAGPLGGDDPGVAPLASLLGTLLPIGMSLAALRSAARWFAARARTDLDAADVFGCYAGRALPAAWFCVAAAAVAALFLVLGGTPYGGLAAGLVAVGAVVALRPAGAALGRAAGPR
ncbi:MAG: hypothetical protein KBD01_11000 [Acidobacteria bacterium]|nr:hypothetical protein [Acidobacteriota bacterium]